MGRPKKEAAPEEVAGAPLWMVTFSDCMNLLLTFFVLLVTFSEFGNKPEEKTVSFGNAMQSVFGPPVETSGLEDKSSMIETQQVVKTERPQYGSETPTDQQFLRAKNGSLNEDLQTSNYRNHKVFLIPSKKVFLGRGKALSADGRYFLAVMAAFLKDAPNGIVISENGPENQAGGMDAGLSRALTVIEYLVTIQNLDRGDFSIAAESIAPPEAGDNSAVAYHRTERMLEIVLLEGGVQ
jgi:chemotaxis protein MotB